jgi:hypothetical protein
LKLNRFSDRVYYHTRQMKTLRLLICDTSGQLLAESALTIATLALIAAIVLAELGQSVMKAYVHIADGVNPVQEGRGSANTPPFEPPMLPRLPPQ